MSQRNLENSRLAQAFRYAELVILTLIALLVAIVRVMIVSIFILRKSPPLPLDRKSSE